ncbi:MAG: T9SS type A sorting domain-containing protein [Candidatus Poribacteria bacterium]|nr:T9SS type A sorting domain-containing protein [Candidatus Poribacteria bacterium]
MRFAHLFVTVLVLLLFAPCLLAEAVTTLPHGDAIYAVEFHPTDGSQFVSASDDHTVKLWNLREKLVTTFSGHTDKVNAVAFSPDGETLVSGSDDKTFKLWSVPQQQHIATLEHVPIANRPASIVTSVAFTPDGNSLGTAGYKTVKFWNVSDWTESGTLQHDDWVSAIVFSPDGERLATVDGKEIKIWDVLTQTHTTTLTADADWVGAITFSPDSGTFAAAGASGQITLWSVPDWTVLGRINAYGSVSDLAFSPDGKTLASAGNGVKLWSVKTGAALVSLTEHTGQVIGVAYSSDGTAIVSGGLEDGMVHFVEFETLELAQPDVVRLIYFLPSDRTAQSDIDSKIEAWVKGAQTFFADTMEKHGYGRKTFTYETDESGKAVVHHIAGQFMDAYYDQQDKWIIWDEIREAGFDPSQNIYIAFMDFSEVLDGLHCGTGGNWAHGGVVNLIASEECLDGDFGLWLAVHEIGHAFGLQHDYRNHSDHTGDLMVAENDLMVSSACSAEWLDAHHYFNAETPFFNEPTTIEMWPPRAVDRAGIRLRFTITDPDGLHQARLLSTKLEEDYFAGRDYLEEQDYSDEYILDCKSLSGSSTTATFITTQLTADNDTVVLRIIDVNGNFTEGRFPIDTTSLSRYLEDVNGDGTVNIQDLVLVAGNFGQTGQSVADVNEDGVVNIQDLVLVAGAFGRDAAAPSVWHRDLEIIPTQAEVQQWLREAQQVNLTDPAFQRGILALEQLLVALTPKETILLPNYPNPFNPETWIPYRLAVPTDVTVSIYSSSGRLVRTLEFGHQSVGIYESRSRAAYWDGRNSLGERVASGVYFYTLTAGDFTATRKMLIRK